MKRTHLKARERELVPAAPETVTAVEAREQTPTLMAGEAAGSQGTVQIWEPEGWRLWPPAIVWTLLVVLMVPLLLISMRYHDPIQVFAGACYLLFCIIAAVTAYGVIRRPCFLTTDDAGIGIRLAGGGTRVLLWRDIIAMERQFSAFTLVTIGEPGRTMLWLSGYPRPAKKAIQDVIIERAGLVQNQFTRQACWYSTGNSARERKWVKEPAETKSLSSGD